MLHSGIPLLDVAGAETTIGRIDALAETGGGGRRDRSHGRSVGEREGGVDAVLGRLPDVLDEGKLRRGERRRDAGLVDEDEAEAGPENGTRIGLVGEAEARREVAVVERAGAAGVAADAQVVELLSREIENGALVVFFSVEGWSSV